MNSDIFWVEDLFPLGTGLSLTRTLTRLGSTRFAHSTLAFALTSAAGLALGLTFARLTLARLTLARLTLARLTLGLAPGLGLALGLAPARPLEGLALELLSSFHIFCRNISSIHLARFGFAVTI